MPVSLPRPCCQQRFKTDTPPSTSTCWILPSCRTSSGLVGPDGLNDSGLPPVLEPVALAGNGHDVSVMQQPVQQRRRQRGVLRKRRVPLAERQVARYSSLRRQSAADSTHACSITEFPHTPRWVSRLLRKAVIISKRCISFQSLLT